MPNERPSISALPTAQCTPVVRTDFSDQEAWENVCRAIESPNGQGFVANVDFIDDTACRSLTAEELVALVPEDYEHPLLVVVDGVALSSDEMPLLCIDLWEERGRTIRVIAREFWGIENNLTLSNMYFDDFAESVDDDGVFRDFR
ncbi:DUF6924 domain-containing protein [Streptomyces sp. NPDC001262]|uniref:DUF6924 domain-containing protein n=1 Tax=Streptomyces sp. NPDC001262 TaxID=3364552 RepID=UPI00369836E6